MGFSRRILVWAGLPLVIGCAQRTLTITSDPPGVEVTVNDELLGRTPVTRSFKDYGRYEVILRCEGYETLKTSHCASPPVYMYPPFDLISEAVGASDRHEWHFVLRPASTQATDPQAILARADELKRDLRSSEFTRLPTSRPTTTTAPSTRRSRKTL